MSIGQRIAVFALLFLGFGLAPISAQLPNTHVYYFEFRDISDSLIINDFKWLTAFNEDGYNNQPSFIADRTVLISSDWQSDQPDIYKLDILSRALTQVTKTAAGEYSPELMPDKRSISCVRQDADGNQYLWSYPVNQEGYGENIFANNLNKFGYYHWMSSTKLAAFYLGDPHELIMIDRQLKGQVKLLDDDIGRVITSKYGMLYYVKKQNEYNWQLMTYNPSSKEKKTLSQMPLGVEDYGIAADGRIYCGQNDELKRLNKDTGEWISIASLSDYGISNIKRLAIRKNKICLVDAP